MNIYINLFLFWISILFFIIYRREPSNTKILFFSLIITYVIIYISKNENIINDIERDKELESWTNTLKKSDNIDETNRCYNIIMNMLLSDGLKSKNSKNESSIQNFSNNSHYSEEQYEYTKNILDNYKNKIPLASNIDNIDNYNYNIAVGFNNKKNNDIKLNI